MNLTTVSHHVQNSSMFFDLDHVELSWLPFSSSGVALVGGEDALPGSRDESRGALELIGVRVVLLEVGSHDGLPRSYPRPEARGLAAIRGEGALHSHAQKRTPRQRCHRCCLAVPLRACLAWRCDGCARIALQADCVAAS